MKDGQIQRGDSVFVPDGHGGGSTMVVHFHWQGTLGDRIALLRPRFSPDAEFFPVRLAMPAPAAYPRGRAFQVVE